MKNFLVFVVLSTFLCGCGGGADSAQTEFKTLPTNMRTTGGN